LTRLKVNPLDRKKRIIMVTLTFEQVSEICADILEKLGASRSDAQLVGYYLAKANLFGHDSHGLQNINYYALLLREGLMKPKAEWHIVRETPGTALIDGGWGLGQIVCTEATKTAMRKAKTVGIGSVGVFNCGHIGRLGEYTTMIADQGMIGIMHANCDPSVAPWGGMGRILGTNPMSYAFPAGMEKTVVVDFASAAVAEGKIRAALYKGEKIPEGWILDKYGKTTTNPADLYGPPLPPEGENIVGAQLPAAGHKGFGLAVAVDILAGALTGAGCDGDVKVGNGVFVQAINIESFIPLQQYQGFVDKLIRDIRMSPKAPGTAEILMPGEPELRIADKRRRVGIPVPDATWVGVLKLARELEVDVDKIVKVVG
jgi:uncharacterized oxidoreductase